MFPLLKYTAEQVDDYFAKVTPEMVEASLAKDSAYSLIFPNEVLLAK